MKVSIVVPTYNSGKYLERTLQSIFIQDYPDYEVLCVDGGSKDNTIEIIKSYRAKSNKFSYIYSPPKGEPDAINQGMKLVNGDIKAFLDSDDVYYPNTLHKVADYFWKNDKVMWLYGKAHIIDQNDKVIRPEITQIKEFFQPRYAYWKLLCLDFITQPTAFWREEVWDEVGEFNTNLKFSFEYDFWCRLGKKYKPAFIDEYLANWRANPEAVSEQQGAHVAEAWQFYKIATSYGKPYLRPIQWIARNLQIAMYNTVTQKENL